MKIETDNIRICVLPYPEETPIKYLYFYHSDSCEKIADMSKKEDE